MYAKYLNNADYLLYSKANDVREDKDQIQNYYKNKLLNSVYRVEPEERDLILFFLHPFEISSIKYTFNKEFFNKPEVKDDKEYRKLIAPSLLELIDNPAIRLKYLPDWFYYAFPDVTLWIILDKGNKIVREEFEYEPVEKIVQEGKFTSEFLKSLIVQYMLWTNNKLQCSVYGGIVEMNLIK